MQSPDSSSTAVPPASDRATVCQVVLWPGEAAQAVPVAPGQTLLAALLAAGVDWPRSCRNGTCRTCLGRVATGRARHTIEWPGLSADEKAEGCVLPCVAVPLGDVTLLPA